MNAQGVLPDEERKLKGLFRGYLPHHQICTFQLIGNSCTFLCETCVHMEWME
jgi:hypothetical protein